MRSMFLSTVAAGLTGSVMALPHVTDVQLLNNVPGTVTVSYQLVDEPAVVTFDIQTNYVENAETKWASIGGDLLRGATGDLNKKLEPGYKLITWKAWKDWPERRIDNGVRAVVTAWATNAPPNYMVIDIRPSTLEERKAAIRFYPDESWLPYGPVTNRIYKSDLIVMRKIPAAKVQWTMGDNIHDGSTWGYGDGASECEHQVMLNKDFYLGVFEITQYQITNGSKWGNPCPEAFQTGDDAPYRAANCLIYHDMRPADEFPQTSLPDNGQGAIQGSCYLKVMSDRIGVRFDLPTQAQWEFACRAGCAAKLYSGRSPAHAAGFVADLDELAWYGANSGDVVHEVGLKKPNAFGLYDMLGNVTEWCIEYAHNATSANGVVVDPVTGPGENTSSRSLRGGSYQSAAMDYVLPYWNGSGAKSGSYQYYYGLRLWAPAEVP